MPKISILIENKYRADTLHIPKRSSLSLVVEDIISGKFLMMPGAPMKCIQKVS